MSVTRFDRWAPHYDEATLQPLYRAAHRSVIATTARVLDRVVAGRGTRILDVGCGTGQLVAAVAHRFPGALVAGVDRSGGMLAAAAAAGRATEPPRLVHAAAERLPFRDGVFDLAVATYSIRHWDRREAGLREIARVLTRDGVFVIVDTFGGDSVRRSGLLRRRAGPLGPRRGLFRLRARTPTAALELALAEAGLRTKRVATVSGYGPIPQATVLLAVKRAPRRPPWRRASRPATPPVGHPAAEPARHEAGHQAGHQASHQARHQAGHQAGHHAGHQAAQPAGPRTR